MGEPLLSGLNHVALAAQNVDATASFYAEVFDLQASELSVAGQERNVLLFFPNGSFLHVIDASADTPTQRIERQDEGNLLYHGDAIDHLSLFATDTAALEKIRSRVVERGASTGELIDTGGVATSIRFRDPDGRKLEVTAYNSQ